MGSSLNYTPFTDMTTTLLDQLNNLPVPQRLRMRGIIARRFAKAFLESQRLFYVWKQRQDTDTMHQYVKTLRRCDMLQELERGIA